MVEKYFLEKTQAILPHLYLLKRGLASIKSADQSALLFNAPDLSGTSAIIGGKELTLEAIGALHNRAVEEITGRELFGRGLVSDLQHIADATDGAESPA